MNRYIIGFLSDTHGGHEHGLVNPETTIEMVEGIDTENSWEEMIQLNHTQETLWEWYEKDSQDLTYLAGESPIILVHNGDIGSGIKHITQVRDTNIMNQVRVGEEILSPWYTLPNLIKVLLATGTGAHDADVGTIGRLVARNLKLRYPHVETVVHSHFLVTLQEANELQIDIAHHGPPPGKRTWLEGNELRLHTRSLMLKDLENGYDPPAILARGHYHTFRYEVPTVVTDLGVYLTHAILLPSYCVMDDFALKATQSEPYETIGMVGVEIVDGRVLSVIPFRRVIDLRREVIIEKPPEQMNES